MRRRLAVPLAIGAAFLVLAVAGCGDDDAVGTSESPAQAPHAEQDSASSDADAAVLWHAPPDPLERTVAAGLEPERKEHLTYHVHAHLDVFIDGEPIAVPAGIGIEIDDPEVQRFEERDGSVAYGGIKRCRKPCISPLHTHDGTGIIHTESASPEPNRLGQFFGEWGVRFSGSCVGEYCSPEPIGFYVDGKRYKGDPRAIELTEGKEIAIAIGAPPSRIPETADFSNA